MSKVNDSRNMPASLFITIDDWDNVVNAAIRETSDDTTRNYLLQELDKVKGYDIIPDEHIVEYRFPDRKSIPPFNPGFLNEYYSRDLYYALDSRNIPSRHISLRVATFLVKNNTDPFQSEDVYRRILKCPEYREFSYLNNNGLYKNPHRLHPDDTARFAAIRTEGGPAFVDILPKSQTQKQVHIITSGTAKDGNSTKSSMQTSRAHGHRERPIIHVTQSRYSKKSKGCSL